MKTFLSYFKQISAMALLFLLIALFVKFLDQQGLRDGLTLWIAKQGRWAFLVFILSAAVLNSALLPGNILGAVAFILFGFRNGVLLMCSAGILSSFLTFFLVRLAFFSTFQKWLKKQHKLLPIATTLQNKGVLFYCLVRISPFHATIINALFALTTMNLRTFAISLCAMLPQWTLYVYFGFAAAEAAASAATSVTTLFRFSSIAIFIMVIVYVSRLVQKELVTEPDGRSAQQSAIK